MRVKRHARVTPGHLLAGSCHAQGGISSSARRSAGWHDSGMAHGRDPIGRPGVQPTDEILRNIEALTDASSRRHRMARDSAEYAVALETEEHLADRIWRLGAALEVDGEPAKKRPRGKKRET